METDRIDRLIAESRRLNPPPTDTEDYARMGGGLGSDLDADWRDDISTGSHWTVFPPRVIVGDRDDDHIDESLCDRCGERPWNVAHGRSGECLCWECQAARLRSEAVADDDGRPVVVWAICAVLAFALGMVLIFGVSNG